MRSAGILTAFCYLLCAAETQKVLAPAPASAPAPAPAIPSHSDTASNTWELGNGFGLSRTDSGQLEISRKRKLIWASPHPSHPSKPFISASAGRDSVTGSNGAFNITHVDLDTCQAQDIEAIRHVQWPGSATGSAAQLTGHLRDCAKASAAYALTFWVPSDLTDRVAFDLNISSSTDSSRPLKKLYFSFASSADEDFYGLGGQASFASLKNQSIPVFTREQGVGRGDEPITSLANANGSIAGGNFYTTYTAVPSYISTDARVFYLSNDSTGYSNFDFTKPGRVTIRYDSLHVQGAFTRTENLFDAIEALTAYTGRQPALPKWVDEGAILGIQGGQDKVDRIVGQGLAIGAPIAAVWLQDWVGTHSQPGPYLNISRLWWNWENDDTLYPTWNQFVQNLRDQYNIRTLSYINVFLTNVSTKETGFRRNLYDEASAAHYFVQNTTKNSTAIISSGPGLEAGVVDLTNPELREWLTEVLRKQVWNANISGFMTDFGEYTPVAAETKVYGQVRDAFFYHNAYPSQWAEYHRGVVESLGLQDEAVLFHRSAAMSSNRNMNLFWAGDQNVDWGVNDGIKSVVTIMLHMGFSGYSQQHSDVGGYTTVLTYQNYNMTRSPELLGRWGELAAVSSAAFRSHEGNIPQVNTQFYSNTSTYHYFAYNAKLFVSLAKYRRHVLETESQPKGWPLLRPPVLSHPDDPRARNISYQSFYLGSHLYVAPVLDPKTLELTVYLPAGGGGGGGGDNDNDRIYEHVWTGANFSGGQEVTVPAPYGKPAVFLVHGGGDAETKWRELLRPFLDFVREHRSTELSVE